MILLTGWRKVNHLNKSAGFTMIELMLVGVIIATLLAVSMPVFGKIYADSQLKSCAKVLNATLRYTYQSSVDQQIKYRMNFDQEENKYWVEIAQNAEEYRQLNNSIVKPVFLPEDVTFKKISLSQIVFYPNGYADNADVQLQNKNNKIYTIHFTGATGHVEIFDYAKE